MSEPRVIRNATSWALNLAFAVFAVALAVVLAQAGLSFGQQLLTAALLIVAGSQLSKLTSKSLPDFHWPILAKGAGWVFLVAVLVNSNFVQKPLEAISAANDSLDDVDGFAAVSACPGIFSQGDVIVVRRGCITELNSPNGTSFRAKSGTFDGLLTQYIDIEQPFTGYYKLKPNKGFPNDVNEVEVMTFPPNSG